MIETLTRLLIDSGASSATSCSCSCARRIPNASRAAESETNR
jgi:hypothetical protein